MKKILFLYQKPMSFIEKDIAILKQKYEVDLLTYRGIMTLFDVIRKVKNYDLVFCWFGKLHALYGIIAAHLFSKKAMVVAGGDDVACERAIHYGMFCDWWKLWCGLLVFRWADGICCVSQFNAQETLSHAKARASKVRMIYHGFDPALFFPCPQKKKEPIVITIGRITHETIVKKGIGLFVKAASLMPSVQCYVVGPYEQDALALLRKDAPSNVIFTGPLYAEKLLEICQRAKVYVQASVHESFGCSVAEAMLCECIPVVSARAALPEVAGDTGVYLDELTPENLAKKIQYALTLPSHYGQQARKRIQEHFSLKCRAEQLWQYVDECCGKK